jgi:hypothetical protein
MCWVFASIIYMIRFFTFNFHRRRRSSYSATRINDELCCWTACDSWPTLDSCVISIFYSLYWLSIFLSSPVSNNPSQRPKWESSKYVLLVPLTAPFGVFFFIWVIQCENRTVFIHSFLTYLGSDVFILVAFNAGFNHSSCSQKSYQ